MSEPPFRSDLEAAHRRIEQLTADYEARLAELRAENVRLLQRVVDANMSRPPRPPLLTPLRIIIGSATILVACVVLFAMQTRRHPPQTVGRSLLPAAGSVDLPVCRCTQGDPLCSEIPGQTCTPPPERTPSESRR